MPPYSNIPISQLPININPNLGDVIPIVNNGQTKKITISGLTAFLNNDDVFPYVTGGTYNNNNGTATFTNSTGGTFDVIGFTTGKDVITGGTYNNNTGITSLVNKTGGTINVSGYPKNVKHWLYNETKLVDTEETLVISGNYVLNNSDLFVSSGNNQFYIGDIEFNDRGQIFIGGNLLILNSNIVNNGEINVAGAIILSGNSTITGTGIII
jgi:hypothetical protein